MTPLDSPAPAPEPAIVQAAVLDAHRLAALRATHLLDTPAEASFDRLTRLAADIIGVPASFMTLVDAERDFYKSMHGPGEPLASTRQWTGPTFCQYLLTRDTPLVLDDVTVHPGYRDIPAVKTLGIRAYAGVPLMTSDGHRLGSFCALDFVPRHWREQDIALLTELAQSAMREIELRQALSQAQASSEAKSRFLSNMSHEIRTPMNAIIGLTYLMARDSQDGILRDRLDKVDLSARHLLHVLDDILDLSKVEAGKMRLECEPFGLAELLGSSLDMVRPAAEAKGLSLMLAAEHLPEQARGDITRLRQALLNLLANAVKFTAQGWVQLRARVLAQDADTLRLRFEVEDTGEGIAPEAQARLFQSFEQADASVSRRHGGTGLGLALTRQLAQLMGGDVGLHSVPGQGSCFWVDVSLGALAPGQASPGEVHASEATEAAAAASWCVLQGKRALLAEDNAVSQLVASELLRELGLTVEVASDGAQALSLALTGRFDAVLLDVQMPELDGLSVARQLRRALGPDLPLIAMTANASPAEQQACLDAGMDAHIAKPVDARLLRQVLGRCVAKRTDHR